MENKITNLKKAWGVGVALLLLGHLFWFVILANYLYFPGRDFLFWGWILLSAIAFALLLKGGEIFNSLLLGVACACIGGLSNFVFEQSGHGVDFHGAESSIYLALISLPWSLVLCGGAGVATWFIRRRA
ncbi:hypothetical protein [Silvimonas amylolytica]|uniref:hypothetical protein n=1 Tax=Silvimonas amylolytica TaxID=449663 RepID=UPI00166574BA|nr:hypothetical protein [Silvimonas amylolytica]